MKIESLSLSYILKTLAHLNWYGIGYYGELIPCRPI